MWTVTVCAAVTLVGDAQQRFLISSSGMGPIRLGMTLDAARRASPAARFSRKVDADGVYLVGATFPGDQVLVLWADEDGDTIDWSKRIQSIETFDAGFATADGVRPGSAIVDVVKRYGRVSGITLSEIESRQFVTFARQPDYLTFRLDDTGIFVGDNRRTTQYERNARVLSIALSSN